MSYARLCYMPDSNIGYTVDLLGEVNVESRVATRKEGEKTEVG